MNKMTEYIDKRGWKFEVMHGLEDVWKACYNKPYRNIWQEVAVLPWRENRGMPSATSRYTQRRTA